jgi:hypothetical protein
MADSEDFMAVARVIEKTTPLNEMQSRGLVRRLLKQAGLDAQDVSPQQLAAVGRSLLREALQKNGVSDADAVIAQWLDCCAKQDERSRASERLRVTNTVEEVFARMGLK